MVRVAYSSDPRFEEVLVDGQVTTFPTAEAWQEITRNPVFLGAPVYGDVTGHLILGLCAFVSKHKEKFRLGMYRARGLRSWSVVPMLVMDGRLQRVHIERITCSQCCEEATIANPTEPSLYFGLPDELAATRAAWRLPRVDCPSCRSPLPRVAVWAEQTTH